MYKIIIYLFIVSINTDCIFVHNNNKKNFYHYVIVYNILSYLVVYLYISYKLALQWLLNKQYILLNDIFVFVYT